MREIWAKCPISGLENYFIVSNLGRVRSVPKTIIDTSGRKRSFAGKELSRTKQELKVTDASGNKQIHLTYTVKLKCSEQKKDLRIPIHKLVLLAFEGSRRGLKPIYHKDSDPNNCCIDNLCSKREWLDQDFTEPTYDHEYTEPNYSELVEPVDIIDYASNMATKPKKDNRTALEIVSDGVCKSLDELSVGNSIDDDEAVN